ncbi:MAG: hypothetical protein FJ288_13500, partial [Planctomycetes bacterium]|nr:hypothetical protein [Planctomycetota bacterium]
MRREDEPFRMSESGLEPAPPQDREGRARPRGAGFQDKKKVIILLALLLAGGGVVAYQFLGGRGPKEAAAVTIKGTGAALPPDKDVNSILERLEAPQAQGAGDASV